MRTFLALSFLALTTAATPFASANPKLPERECAPSPMPVLSEEPTNLAATAPADWKLTPSKELSSTVVGLAMSGDETVVVLVRRIVAETRPPTEQAEVVCDYYAQSEATKITRHAKSVEPNRALCEVSVKGMGKIRITALHLGPQSETQLVTITRLPTEATPERKREALLFTESLRLQQ